MTAGLMAAREYPSSCRRYAEERRIILDGGGAVPVERHGGGRWSGYRATESKAARLEALEALPWVKQMRAVEKALEQVGTGLPDGMRENLRKTLLLNCQCGRKYPFERLFLPGISRSDYYRRRRKFLQEIEMQIKA